MSQRQISPLKAVIFDLDGTLIDSAPSLHCAAAAMMADLGWPAPDLTAVTGMVGHGVPTLVRRVLQWARAPLDLQPEAERAFRTHYDADPVTGVTVFEGVHSTLHALRARGLALGLCTNKPATPTHHLLASLRLAPFDAVVSGDTLPQRKPDPAPLLHCADRLGQGPQDVIYVGDSVVDAQTAEAANIAYVHVTAGYQNGALRRPPRVTLGSIADLPHFLEIY